MAKPWCVPKIVLRAAIWKATPQPSSVGLLSLIAWTSTALLLGVAYEYFQAGAASRFVPYGLNATIAYTALTLAVAAFFVRPEGRTTFLSALMALYIINVAVSAVIAGGMLAWTKLHFESPDVLRSGVATTALFCVYLLWWLGAVRAILRSVEPERRVLLRPAGLWLALLVVYAAMPYQPVFRGPAFDLRRANLWEYIPALLEDRFADDNAPPPRMVDRKQVELAQPAMLDAETSYLAPSVAGKTNIYTIGIAGWSEQGVFVKELDGGIKSLSQVLPLDGHVIRLVNRLDTASNTPVASLQNFAAAVHAVARVMDRERDVLLLFMTSHGSSRGVALRLDGAIYDSLSPRDVALVLDGEAITNRIVIVSACYSGVFIEPLANDNSVILTAADQDHPSFGCSDKREWTYFGDAFFNRSLMPGEDLKEAFVDAKATIAQWETSEGLTPSNPQAHFGRALMDKLASVYLRPNFAAPMKSAAGLERAATP
jgi:hypothetical protein